MKNRALLTLALASLAALPTSAQSFPQCTPVQVSAATGGAPPLAHAWTLSNGSPLPATNPTTLNTDTLPPGSYTLTLTVTNTSSQLAPDGFCLDPNCGFLACRSPAQGVPALLWGTLRPTDTGNLPANRDSTAFDEFQHSPDAFPHWMSLDEENGWIFAAVHRGLQVWSTTPDPAHPTRIANLGRTAFPTWPPDPHEGNPVRAVDAAPADDTAAAVGLGAGGGVVLWDTRNKSAPIARYGDRGKTAEDLYSGRLGSTAYTFAAAGAAGVLTYNLTAARNRTSLCLDTTPTLAACGVYIGRFGFLTSASYIAGVGDAAASRIWLAVAGGDAARGLELWSATNPAAPQRLLAALTADFVHGPALWRDGAHYYLAARVLTGTRYEARIYDVTCITTATCTALAPPLWRSFLSAPPSDRLFTTASRGGGGRSFLYFGGSGCGTGLQSEYLFDVSDPVAPIEITPPADFFGDDLTGYWGWYYRPNPTGFNRVAPRIGRFNGEYFYRAAYSLFDIHELAGDQPPVADFTFSPTTVYRGRPVSFTDTSTGPPATWSWTFSGAAPVSSSAQHPTATFLSTGPKTALLTVRNDLGQDTTSQLLQVLDPAPTIAGISFVPDPNLTCSTPHSSTLSVDAAATHSRSFSIEALTLHPTATNLGNRALAFNAGATGANFFRWTFGDGTPQTPWLAGCDGHRPSHTYPATGTYSVTLKAKACSGSSVLSQTFGVSVTQDAPIGLTFEALGCNPFCIFATPTVHFTTTLTAGNVTSYSYDWDGNASVDETSPLPIPSHTYTATGFFTPKVTARNPTYSTTATAPILFITTLDASIFADGFETGDTSAWTLTFP